MVSKANHSLHTVFKKGTFTTGIEVFARRFEAALPGFNLHTLYIGELDSCQIPGKSRNNQEAIFGTFLFHNPTDGSRREDKITETVRFVYPYLANGAG